MDLRPAHAFRRGYGLRRHRTRALAHTVDETCGATHSGPHVREQATTAGALVGGGDYRALGVVRSLGRRGIPVWVVTSADDHKLAGISRFARRRLVWPDGDHSRLSFLLSL